MKKKGGMAIHVIHDRHQKDAEPRETLMVTKVWSYY